MSLYELLGTVEVGLIFGLVALGAFITFRILDFPDLTVEGSFPLGAAVAAVLIVNFGWNPWPATLAAAAAGFGAGFITAYLNVRFNILHILAGILVSISLYSVNLRIMGGPNKPLLGAHTIFSTVQGWGVPAYILSPLLLACIILAIKLLLDLFLHTGIGMNMRAAGANPAMAAANGVNVGRMKLIGLGMANALTALAGAMFAQSFGAADAYMGIGRADLLEHAQAALAAGNLRQAHHAGVNFVIAGEDDGFGRGLRQFLEQALAETDEIELQLGAASEIDRRKSERIAAPLLHQITGRA